MSYALAVCVCACGRAGAQGAYGIRAEAGVALSYRGKGVLPRTRMAGMSVLLTRVREAEDLQRCEVLLVRGLRPSVDELMQVLWGSGKAHLPFKRCLGWHRWCLTQWQLYWSGQTLLNLFCKRFQPDTD